MNTEERIEERVEALEQKMEQAEAAANEISITQEELVSRHCDHRVKIREAEEAVKQHADTLMISAERFQEVEKHIKKLEIEQAYLRKELTKLVGLYGRHEIEKMRDQQEDAQPSAKIA